MTQDTAPQEAAKLAAWLARRQFGMALVVLLGTAALLLGGRIDQAAWQEVTIWTIGLYLLGEAGGAWAIAWGRKP